jgi:membrane-associated phospholipid phosphatase
VITITIPTILTEFTNLQNPALDFFALIFTFLGNEEFYFLIIPFIYWCVSKKIGFRLFYIFLLSVYVNSFLKISYAIERPIGTEGVNSLFISSAEVGSHYPYDSFPSGHAQGSATLWGYLATVIRRPVFVIFAMFLILFISVSRLYTGLHWPTDVIIGVLLGGLFVLIGVLLQERISKLASVGQWFLIFLVPLVLVLFFPEEEGMQYAGILLGAGVGYMIQEKFVMMKIDERIMRKLIAFVIGIIGTFALQVGLKAILPESGLFDFIRYGTMGLWITLVAPYFFMKLAIYQGRFDAHIKSDNHFPQ